MAALKPAKKVNRKTKSAPKVKATKPGAEKVYSRAEVAKFKERAAKSAATRAANAAAAKRAEKRAAKKAAVEQVSASA